MNKQSKIDYVMAQIDSFNDLNSSIAKRVIKDRKTYYENRSNDIKALNWSNIIGHDFHYEIETRIEIEQKKAILKKRVLKLERHAYAPEMNTLWFKSGKKRIVYNKTTIKDAIVHVIGDGITLAECKSI